MIARYRLARLRLATYVLRALVALIPRDIYATNENLLSGLLQLASGIAEEGNRARRARTAL